MSTGSIRQRGTAWELKWEAGPRGPSGRRKTRYETFHGNRRQAQARLRELLSQVDRGMAADAGQMTTSAWLATWLNESALTVSPKT